MTDTVVEHWYEIEDYEETPLEKEIKSTKLEFSKLAPGHDLTLLMFACMTGNEKAVLALLKSGENVNEKNMRGHTALTRAVLSGNLKSVQILVSNCANVNCTVENGDTPLMLAATHGFDDIVRCLITADPRKSKKSYTALWQTTLHGQLKCMQTLIKAGINLNATDLRGMTVLMRAAAEGLFEVVECLAQAGAKVNLQCKYGRTALSYAASNGYLSCVKRLHGFKADLNLSDNNEHTPLMKAVMMNDIHIVFYLARTLKENDLNSKCKNGKTAIFYAAELGFLECVRIFGDRCINETDNEGNTPLTKAISQNHSKVVEYLLRRGARCNTVTNDGMSSIHCAAAAGSLENFQNVLLHDARNVKNVANLQNRHGQTPLMIAALNRHHEIVKYLLIINANVNVRCYKSWTALHYATHGGKISCIRSIAMVISDVNQQTKEGISPLMIACTKGMHSVVLFLIGLKVDINMKCEAGRSALHYAALRGSSKCIEELLKAKALIGLKDRRGESPLILAARCGRTKMVEFLKQHNANENTINKEGRTAFDYTRRWNPFKRINFLYEIANRPIKEQQKQRGKYSKKLLKKFDYNCLMRKGEFSVKHSRRFDYHDFKRRHVYFRRYNFHISY